MRPLRVRERTLADGSMGYSVDGSPTDAVSLAFLGFFEERFDLVASGINYGANLGDDITYSGHGVRGDGGGDQQLPGVRDLAGVLRAGRLRARVAGRGDRRPQHPRARPEARRAAQRQRPGGLDRRVRGVRGHARRAARLPGPARRSASTRAASPTTGWAGRRRRGSASRAPTSTRSSTGGSRSRRSTSTSPAAACCASSRRGTGRSRTTAAPATARRPSCCRQRAGPTRPRRRGSRRSRSSSAARQSAAARRARRATLRDALGLFELDRDRSSSACPAQARGWCSRTSHRRSTRASRRHR